MSNKSIEERVLALESQLCALKEMYLNVTLQHVKLLDRELNKKPYKCPICKGNGKLRTRYEYDTYGQDEFGRTYTIPAGSYSVSESKCNSCEGQGVLWG